MANARKSIFVSYAHADRKWVDELVTYLAPWIRKNRLNLWDDARIGVGRRWKTEIRTAMENASVAVLLVTKDFLNSKFVIENELPTLLKRAEKGQLRLAWIAVSPSGVEVTPLWQYQAVNDPKRPLDTLSKPQRGKVMVDIARTIADAATISTFAGGLNIIDETAEPLEAALDNRPEEPQRQFSVQARYEPVADRISFSGLTQTITAEDLKLLPDEDREFIADLEDALRRNYKRWRKVRTGLGDAGGALDGEVEGQLNRIARSMCRDLNAILDFLRKMHMYQLEDHYGRYRYICEQLYGT